MKLSGDAPHRIEGVRSLPCARPASPAQPRPRTGRARRMPRADAGRFQPGEARAFRVLRRGGARPPPCASPSPSISPHRPAEGPRSLLRAAARARQEKLQTGGRWGMERKGLSRLWDEPGGAHGCTSQPLLPAQGVPCGMAEPGRAPRSSAQGRGQGPTAEQPPGTRGGTLRGRTRC